MERIGRDFWTYADGKPLDPLRFAPSSKPPLHLDTVAAAWPPRLQMQIFHSCPQGPKVQSISLDLEVFQHNQRFRRRDGTYVHRCEETTVYVGQCRHCSQIFLVKPLPPTPQDEASQAKQGTG